MWYFQVGVNAPRSSPLVTASARSGQDRSLFSRSIDGSPISLLDEDDRKSGSNRENSALVESSLSSYESFISMLLLLSYCKLRQWAVVEKSPRSFLSFQFLIWLLLNRNFIFNYNLFVNLFLAAQKPCDEPFFCFCFQLRATNSVSNSSIFIDISSYPYPLTFLIILRQP